VTGPRGGSDRFSLAGKVAIVTGGGRGLGRGLSAGLAEAGATVVAAGRSVDVCIETVEEIEAHGGSGLAVAADVTVAADRDALVARTIEAFGRLDVLINNAAILRPHQTLKVTEEEIDDIVALNLKAPVLLSQRAFPHLQEDGGGSIINVSALSAFQPMPGLGAYSAVKAGMVAWTSAMAKEWTPLGVRVNSLVPGPVATDMILPRDAARRDAFIAEMSAETLVGRIAEPDDLVGAAVFLASDASAFMTGRQLFVDGGMMA
jgi:NAD(P)-dependent dehydrogenase (short-subunit alcohol dehydrogenase family)